jgi:hypothetical protein
LSKIFFKNNQTVHKKRQENFLPFFFFCQLKNNYMKSTARKIKEKFFYPTPVFGQLVALVNQANVESVIRKTKADKHSKKFKTKDLYTMLVAVICHRYVSGTLSYV